VVNNGVPWGGSNHRKAGKSDDEDDEVLMDEASSIESLSDTEIRQEKQPVPRPR